MKTNKSFEKYIMLLFKKGIVNHRDFGWRVYLKGRRDQKASEKKAQRVKPNPPPRYDAVYSEGTKMFDDF